ncbi:MAG: hypothetical protein A2487_18240 [Candidatus Raymondbacteria bacterium RifOxyC12_full_50_8]|uniref:Lipid A deacylase LpxR family protein n=1 Tax=Candidatus Raymondbacteria bacterium RIFOXYD12_FULL_49_13 TaxID=1817890 RepID=A0A1F7F587_UNCRA|nr:MAG: hypothetical protein A2350_08280 [Candidatus Raymondbacteria bacterium RifOxyB12_full_50_8]OGJ87177.1 MAG: hypothetical protein A2248_04045 [Candidatus Raymondbacteria bacterium RIFOXYA2_FULL_49_16]OGJ95342.1 MAG: hypothetical protein A2487_18240 [Candidatus Raymondbacteria bacterium RifOxyC12_full_50_8]OGK01820.1 MAG: hypothetical protein A2519_03080 [Candidatus Raymondbacteria bacterium RIFOXYD12_FULL_49_13]OGP41173.1 MAG: hypothetical protein A2324_08690 [Candidatus Raymondbacteria b
MKTCIILICLVFSSLWSQTGNTISKNDFNFALQSGYLYSRTDNAYFKNRGAWSFETGFVSFYTEKVPRVTNPDWQERLFLQVPFGFEIFPSDNIALQINSDAIAEFPRHPVLHHSIGGNSPRFRTKIKLLDEKPYVPALALTVGVTFSSAKPFNIWTRRHNYDESNGLAGPGTGVADYLLLITASKHLTTRNFIHARCGLLPMGDPTIGDTSLPFMGSSQADEIPYGISLETNVNDHWTLKNEVAGMYGILESTPMAHYSVFRTQATRTLGTIHLTLNVEKGLTRYSDDWVAGMYVKFDFGATPK